MQARLGDGSTADLNISRLDGRTASEDELRTAVTSIPFLAERRLVILTHPVAKLQAEAARQRFLTLLEALPQTTALVLLIEDEFWRKDWEFWQPKHWLYQWAKANPARMYERLFAMPSVKEMPAWIMNKARELGGKFTPAAAARLAEFAGAEPYIAAQEIEKLLTYVNRQRAVEVEDVQELSILTAEADVFKLTDALAERNAQAAQMLMRRLLEQTQFSLIYGLVIRQFRLLLAAREALEEGGGLAEIKQAVGSYSDFVAGLYQRQAQRFSLPALTAILRRLLELDYEMKSGGMVDNLTAMDLFIAELAG